MLNTISWGDFISGMVILLIIYYTVIGMLYYRSEILQMFARLTSPGRNNKENVIDESIEETK